MKRFNVRWQLVLYDILILLLSELLLLPLYQEQALSHFGMLWQVLLTAACTFGARFVGRIYQQVWRYGGIQCYVRLLLTDGVAFWFNLLFEIFLPEQIAFSHLLAICGISLLGSLAIRMIYRYAYKYGTSRTLRGRVLNLLLRIFAGADVENLRKEANQKIQIAIVGAGRVGVSLFEELLNSSASIYRTKCFVDVDPSKIGRTIHGIPVITEGDTAYEYLREMDVQEVVFAMPDLNETIKKDLCDRYLRAGFRVKVYDFPLMQKAGKRQLRDFDIAELLFRRQIHMYDEKTSAYYHDKVILITGGGGSIGSELCRQLAGMAPKQIIVLDIYENGAYDVQQELKITYGDRINLQIEIASICNKRALTRVFEAYHPDIVINAAAHKHVPLIEHNCIEAVENNIFGTKNLVELCEAYGTARFMMVSTDKAVNPTNVMGATKRMCEMIVQSAATYGNVKYSTTRFGNVLGSAGSVIPLFKKQIANGGPITLTDKRMIRYFMTIPEASQLVLQSGAMANNGELFVLDMGQPVKILDLAEGMIRLSGATGIEIIETGLRPGEKLYEELLVETEKLDRTENSLIFIERDTACTQTEIDEKLYLLRVACASDRDDEVRKALHQVVPTFKNPNEVNATAEYAKKMQCERLLV